MSSAGGVGWDGMGWGGAMRRGWQNEWEEVKGKGESPHDHHDQTKTDTTRTIITTATTQQDQQTRYEILSNELPPTFQLIQPSYFVRQMLQLVAIQDQLPEAFELPNGRRELDEFVERGTKFAKHVQVPNHHRELEHVVVRHVQQQKGLRKTPNPGVQIDPRTVGQVEGPIPVGLDQHCVVGIVHGWWG